MGVDGLDTCTIKALVDPAGYIHWVMADSEDSPATIRQKVIERVISRDLAVVFVDTDDVLYPARIEAAVDWLTHSDLTSCPMELVDEHDRDLVVCSRKTGPFIMREFC